jgi:hypothetical protein
MDEINTMVLQLENTCNKPKELEIEFNIKNMN